MLKARTREIVENCRYAISYLTSTYHFIHIPKNGGMAVREALRGRGVHLTQPFHYRYRDITQPKWMKRKYFCIVRNPWSRTASRFQYAKQQSKNWASDDPRRLYIEKATFSDYVRDRRIINTRRFPEQPWMGPMSSWLNQLEWITDSDGEVQCDCLRLEVLDDDLQEYFGERIEVQPVNRTKSSYDYRSMYTPDLVDLVSDYFSEDILHFGFDFDSPARRNIAIQTRSRTQLPTNGLG